VISKMKAPIAVSLATLFLCSTLTSCSSAPDTCEEVASVGIDEMKSILNRYLGPTEIDLEICDDSTPAIGVTIDFPEPISWTEITRKLEPDWTLGEDVL